MAPADPAAVDWTFVADWVLRIVMGAASVFVYLLGLDRKQQAELITMKFSQLSGEIATLRLHTSERFDRLGKQASDYADQQQAAIGRAEARIETEHGKRRVDIDGLNINMGKLQLAQAVTAKEVEVLTKIVERRELQRRDEDR